MPLGAAYTYMAYMREYPPPPPPRHRFSGSHSPAIAAIIAAAKFEKLPQWIQDTLLRVNHFEMAAVDPK